MKYLVLPLQVLLIRCSNPHQEIEIDPLSKSYILEKIVNNSAHEKSIVFFMYPEFCGMCTEEIVYLINDFSIEGYSKYVALTQENEITEKLNLPARYISLHDKLDLERHGLGFATGHLFLIEDGRFIYSQIVNEETFSIVEKETKIFFEK